MDNNQFKIIVEAGLDIQKSHKNIKDGLKQLPQQELSLDLNKSKLEKDIKYFIQSNGKLKDSTKKALQDILSEINNVNSNADTSNLRKQFQLVSKEAKILGQTGDTWLGKFRKNLGEFATFLSAGTLIMGGLNTIRSIISTVNELDKSLVDLQMATGMNRQEASKLLDTYNALASELGATTKEVADAAGNWLRQGKSISDTNTLIRDSMILSKVGQIDSAQATSYLTTAMKGYGVATENVIGIVDKLTAIDLISATNAGGLAEGMSQVATNADLAGISMDKLLGYLAVIGETTGASMSNVGNSLSTIFSRMANVKLGRLTDPTSGDDLNNVETSLDNVGIKLREDNKTFRDFGLVLDETANKWSSFDEVNQRAIAVSIAGKDHMEDFLVLMNNYNKSLEYAEAGANSSGTAMKKFQDYENSTEAATKRLTAQFEKLALDTLDSSVVRGFLNVSTAVLKLTDEIGLFNVAILVTVGSLTALGKGQILQNIGLYFITIAEKMTGATIAASGLNMALATMIPVAILMAGIAIFDKLSISLEEQQQKVSDLTNEYKLISDEIDALNEKKLTSPIDNELTDNEKKRLDFLEKYRDTLKETIQLEQDKEAKIEWFGEGDNNPLNSGRQHDINAYTSLSGGILSALSDERNRTFDKNDAGEYINTDKIKSNYEDLLFYQGELLKQSSDLQKELETPHSEEVTQRLQKQFEDLSKTIENNETSLNTLRNTGVIPINIDSSDVEKASDNINQLANNIKTTEELTQVLSTLDDKMSSLSKAYQEQTENGSIADDTLISLMKSHENWKDLIISENGVIKLNKEAVLEYAKAKVQAQIDELESTKEGTQKRIVLYENEISVLQNLASASGNAAIAMSIAAQMDELGGKIAAANEEIEGTNLVIAALNNKISQMGNNSDPFGNLASSAKSASQAMSQANSAINSLSSDISAMLKQRYQEEDEADKKRYQNKIDRKKKEMEADKEEAEEYYDTAQAKVQAQLDILKAEQATESYRESLSEKESNKAKIEADLITAQLDDSEAGKKRVRELQEQLKSANSDIEDLQYDRKNSLLEDGLNKQLDAIQKERDAELQSIEDTYNARIESLEAQLERVESNARSEADIRRETFELINKGGQQLYNDLIEYNRRFGSGIDNEVKAKWENAYTSLQVFGDGEINVLDTLNLLAEKMNDFDIATQSAAKSAERLADALAQQKTHSDPMTDEGDYYSGLVNVKGSHKNGGVIDYTGLAMLHGTPSNPEAVVNSDQVGNFFKALQNPYTISSLISNSMAKNVSGLTSGLSAITNNSNISNTPSIVVNVTGNATPDTVMALKSVANSWLDQAEKRIFSKMNSGSLLGY